jgi:hypothetical protein
MPTFRHGKQTAVFINGTNMSAFLNSASSTMAIETAETTTFGDQDKTYITGLSDGTVSMSGFFDSTAGASDAVLSGMIATADNAVSIFPQGNVITRPATVVNGQMTAYDISSPVGDVVALSAEVQADGGLFYGFDLVGADVRTSTGTSAVQDNAALTTGGVSVNLHVHANTRNGTTIVKVQHSSDNSTYVDLVTFTTISAAATVGENIAISGTVNRYLRASYTLAGSTGSVSSAISLARR